jgi:putative SOS response-associated peptidase YedK
VSPTLSNTRTESSCYLLGFTTVRTLKVDHALDKKLILTKGALGSEQPLWSFSIVTTPASKDFEWLHDRQPVILVSEDDIARWLNPDTDKWTKELSQLVQPSETHPTLQW